MSYLSFNFAGFLFLSLLIYYSLPTRWKERWVLALSLFFYCSWSVPHALLLILSVLIFWQAALRVESAPENEQKFRYFLPAVLFQLLILFSYKFMQGSSQWGRFSVALPAWAKWVMPLGLSYYSFKLIGYLAEVYTQKIPAEKNLVSLANYAAFFSQIMSGPIQRSGDFFKQTKREVQANPEALTDGLRLILFGLFKKLVVADALNSHITQFIGGSTAYDHIPGVLATYFIPLQIYADFSGLTDIARGIAKLFGIDSPVNFKNPFYASSIPEFWRRWHMTLTGWITEFIFLPLNISLRSLGNIGLYASVFANMVLIGLWHGLTWNFLAFGLFHAVLICASLLTKNLRSWIVTNVPGVKAFRKFAAPIWTFHLAAASFVIFRADSFQTLRMIWNNIQSTAIACSGYPGWQYELRNPLSSTFGMNSLELGKVLASLLLMETIHGIQNVPSLILKFTSAPAAARWMFYTILGLSIIYFGSYDDSRFVYSFF